ncbi:MAG: polysaccharide deacetylase family protein [Clostridium sp.]
MKRNKLFKKWTINLMLICCIVGISVFYSTGKGMKVFNSALANNNSIPVHSVEREDKTIAITINTGFSEQYTDEILKLLRKEGVKATFFTTGAWIDMYRNDAVKIHKNGHEIGNNSLTYPHISHLSRENLEREILGANEKIKMITGKTVGVFRPPYGEYSDKSQRAVSDMDMVSVVWNLDFKDYELENNEEEFLEKVTSGSILLFTNNSSESYDKLQKTITTLKKQGYKFNTVSEMIYKDSYYIDHTGRQKSI